MTGQIATIFIAYFAILANAANIKRITNGENAQINEISFIVALRDNSGSQSCGGSLVDSFTVLTAAHCVSSASSVTAGIIVSIYYDISPETIQILCQKIRY